MPGMSGSSRDVLSSLIPCFIACHTAPCAYVSCKKELVATRVRSKMLSKTRMTVTISFKFGGSRGSNEVRSPLIFEHCASPTVDGRGPPWFGLEYY